jgi:hypothetical protein
LNPIAERVAAFDTTLFDGVPAQSSPWDKQALLALQAAAAETLGSFAYLEIGSYLGGSLQALAQDPRCERIISIDLREPAAPDARTGTWAYDDNSTTQMLAGLRELPEADVDKITTFDAGTESVSVAELPVRPDYCFIDGEHTDAAVLRDARFCAEAMGGRGVVAFHDSNIVGTGIRDFLRESWSDVSLVVHPRRGGRRRAGRHRDAACAADCRSHRCALADRDMAGHWFGAPFAAAVPGGVEARTEGQSGLHRGAAAAPARPVTTDRLQIRSGRGAWPAAATTSTSPVRGMCCQCARTPTSALIVDSMITRYINWR